MIGVGRVFVFVIEVGVKIVGVAIFGTCRAVMVSSRVFFAASFGGFVVGFGGAFVVREEEAWGWIGFRVVFGPPSCGRVTGADVSTELCSDESERGLTCLVGQTCPVA